MHKITVSFYTRLSEHSFSGPTIPFVVWLVYGNNCRHALTLFSALHCILHSTGMCMAYSFCIALQHIWRDCISVFPCVCAMVWYSSVLLLYVLDVLFQVCTLFCSYSCFKFPTDWIAISISIRKHLIISSEFPTKFIYNILSSFIGNQKFVYSFFVCYGTKTSFRFKYKTIGQFISKNIYYVVT